MQRLCVFEIWDIWLLLIANLGFILNDNQSETSVFNITFLSAILFKILHFKGAQDLLLDTQKPVLQLHSHH